MNLVRKTYRVRIVIVLSTLQLFASTIIWAQSTHQLFLGTGEYDATASWDAILIFDNAETINGNRAASRTIDFATAGGNFPHMLYYWETRDELFVTSLFTNEIFVFATASSMGAGATPARIIGGPSTSMNDPHGLWVDETRDILYVASRFDATGASPGNVLAWSSASSVFGNVAPRIIGGPLNTGLGQPFNCYVDEPNDRLYVASANTVPAVVIFDNASTLTGDVAFTRKIAGPTTTFGSHPTVHNVFLDPSRDEIYVCHHQSDILVFGSAGTVDGDVAPTRTLSGFQNVLGMFYIQEEDTLYVSDAVEGPPDCVGGPCPGSPPQSIKVFYNASTLNGSVAASYDRIIYFEPQATDYYPPQPIWVVTSASTPMSANSNRGLVLLTAAMIAAFMAIAYRMRRNARS